MAYLAFKLTVHDLFADNTQSDVQALGANSTIEDSFTAVSADGGEQVVTVTITGVDDAEVLTGVSNGTLTEDTERFLLLLEPFCY